MLFHSLTDEAWNRKILHPERGEVALRACAKCELISAQALSSVLEPIVWHGRHPAAHITDLRKRMGW
jgi:hypothetical protein